MMNEMFKSKTPLVYICVRYVYMFALCECAHPAHQQIPLGRSNGFMLANHQA